MKKIMTFATVAALVALAGPAAMAKTSARKGRPGVHAPVKNLKQAGSAKKIRPARPGHRLAKRTKKSANQNPSQNG